MKKPTTLGDVARLAAVHKATAGRALRGDTRITVETRKRVEVAAKRLGYRVSPLLAAWMSSRRTGAPTVSLELAYVTAHRERFGWQPPASDLPDFFGGARGRAAELGYVLQDFWIREAGMTPNRFLRILRARNIQGVIIGRMPGDSTTLLDFNWERFSVVALGVSLYAPIFHRVREDHFFTGSTAARRCREKGCKRIGLVFSRPDDSGRVADMWAGGFLSEQVKWTESDRVAPLLRGGSQRAAFLSWFRASKPDAIIATQARPVHTWLRELGLTVPRDLSLVELRCYDPAAGYAGVYYDPGEIGMLGVDMLIGMMHRQETGIPTRPYEIIAEGGWIAGNSFAEK